MSNPSVLPLMRTPVDVGRPLRLVGLGDRNVFLGSCFAEHIGQCFQDNLLPTLVNPLGVLYNPVSIARLVEWEGPTHARDYIYEGEMWHTWLGSTLLSRPTEDACRQATDQALAQLHDALDEADNLFLTLGTSRCYQYCRTGEIVANCHRVASREFNEVEPEVEELVEVMSDMLTALRRRNGRLQVVLTVSPYRYQKYGFHQSQLSKARLLLCADALCRRFADWVAYFPAYELVVDELRDYRYYAADMLHPSDQAVDYVWQRFVANWMDSDVRTWLERWRPLSQALAHRPLCGSGAAYETFRQRTRQQLEQLQHDYPMMKILGD